MKNKIILSSLLATLLISQADASSLLERFEAMEKEMEALRAEIKLLKSGQTSNATATPKVQEMKFNLDLDDEKEEKGEMKFNIDLDAEDEAHIAKKQEQKPSTTTKVASADVEKELEQIKANLAELNKSTSGSHLKFGVDYRFASDTMKYKMADGSKAENDAFLTNRLWINMDWAATNNISFHGQLAYNKAFGNREGASTQNQLEAYDWISNENAYDGTLRLRLGYFYYTDNHFLGSDVPWTFSIGRRSSTNGLPINLREDDGLTSPLAHTMNVEFDGLSTKYSFNKWVKGMKLQFCAGRGLSNAQPKFSSTPFATNNAGVPDVDLAGIVFTGYDDGKYLLKSQYYYAHNLIDVVNPLNYGAGFKTVGDMHSGTALFMVNGIGDGWSDYLDDSKFFTSLAMTKTDPKATEGMLGSANGESKTGYSYWLGAQFPSLVSEDGRMGLEFNHGSQFWRGITYGEDTNIGSKLATRGDAYEIYFTEYLVDEILSLQLRYTYIDYDYAGSNGFFGNSTGTATPISSAMTNAANNAESAQDIRLYLRYKY